MTGDASRYDYEFDPQGDTTGARLCRLVGHKRHVLELGCAAGTMTAVLNEHYGCTVVGVEQDKTALERARPYCEAVVNADLDDSSWPSLLPDKVYDTVLAADVLEHLRDPLACMRQARTLLGPEGELVVSVPNIAHSGVIAALLANDFPYRETGLLDRTHIYFFTSLTLGNMLHAAGFEVVHTETVDADARHPEFEEFWPTLPESTKKWLIDRPAARPYQIIMRARLAESAVPYHDVCQAETLAWLRENEAGNNSDALVAEHNQRLQVLNDTLAAEHNERVQALKAALVAEHTQRVQGLNDALEQAESRAEDAESALEAVFKSRSWRITAPLRKLFGK